MATGGGDFSSSLILSSDQVFDRNCTLCEDDDTVSEAVCYCTVCYKYYCTSCRGFHNKFHPDHRDGLVEGAAMLKSQPKRPASVALTTRCEEHQDEMVKMYCYDHDVVCCTVCLAIHHKKCAKPEYIPNIASGFSKHTDIAKIKRDLQDVRKDLADVKSQRKQDQTRIKKEKYRVLGQVEDYRRTINAVLDRLEEAVIQGADTRYESCVITIQTDLNECNAAINKLEKSIKDLENADKHKEGQMFVHVKKGAENIDKLRQTVDRIQDKIGMEKIKFNVNSGIQEYLDKLETLGEFVDEYMEHVSGRGSDRNTKGSGRKGTDVDMVKGESKTKGNERKGIDVDMVKGENETKESGGKGTDADMVKGLSKPRTVVRKEDVVMKKDNSLCRIQGSCCLPDGGALLSDYGNHKLKRLDPSHQITDTCFIACPRGVCYIEPSHEAAVCALGAIKIVSLGKQMEVTVVRTIEMDRISHCGVAYYNGLLYVSEEDGDNLYVYDYATEQRSLTVDTDSQGKKIFSRTQQFATNTDGTRIWVADEDNGLIQLDEHCNVVRVVKTKEMGYTTGVCVDNEDNVYVCGKNPSNVLQLTSSGEKVSTLCGPDELPRDPRSVSYDNKQSRLLVTMLGTDTIKVIYFK